MPTELYMFDLVEEMVPERVEKVATRNGRRQCLVLWRNACGLRTWEDAEELVEGGHLRVLNSFYTQKWKGQKKHTTAPIPASTVPPPVSGSSAVPTTAAHSESPRVLQATFNPSVFWYNYVHHVARFFHISPYRIARMYNICDAHRATLFYRLMKKLNIKQPTMLFHGTQSQYVPQIIQEGLRVPLTGANPIPVRNGQAHGIGIYTGRSASLSMAYSQGLLLVCAGIVEKSVYDANGCVVFDDSRFILPCFVLNIVHNEGQAPSVPLSVAAREVAVDELTQAALHAEVAQTVQAHEARHRAAAKELPRTDSEAASQRMKAFQRQSQEHQMDVVARRPLEVMEGRFDGRCAAPQVDRKERRGWKRGCHDSRGETKRAKLPKGVKTKQKKARETVRLFR